MLTLRVSMAPLPVAGARLSAVEEWSRRIVSLPLLASIKASRKSIAEHCAAEASKWSVLRLGCHPETPVIEPCRFFFLAPASWWKARKHKGESIRGKAWFWDGDILLYCACLENLDQIRT